MSLQRGDRIGGRFEIVSDGPVAIWVLGRDPKCKDVRCGGTHYHCTRCGAVTSMTGHAGEADCERAREQGLDDLAWVAESEAES